MIATSYMWLLNTWNMAGMTEELHSKFYFILMQLKLNGHMWLLSVILQSTFNGFNNFASLQIFCPIP